MYPKVSLAREEMGLMIEILFGDSEAGSMKAAKNKIVVGKVNGPVSVWMAGKKTPPQNPFTGWIEGTSEEVICLGFMMDIGNIKVQMDSPYRRELIYSMYAQNQWEQDGETEEELKNAGDVYAKELYRLMEFLDHGEAVRIWYSDTPYSRCGFYSLCQILKGYENEISAVKLPAHIVRENCIFSYQSWSEVSAEEFAGFLPYEKALSKEEVRMYAMLWSELIEENSPLRAVVNGKVLSVPEDFYDFLTRINRKSFAFLPHFEYNKEKRWRMCLCYLRINMLTKSMERLPVMTVWSFKDTSLGGAMPKA